MVPHEHPGQTTPEETGEGTHPRLRDQAAENPGQNKSGQSPPHKTAMDDTSHRILGKVGQAADRHGIRSAEHPAHVGVPETEHQALHTLTVFVRRMRIALHIAVLVMAPMRGHPEEQRPLHGHGSGDAEQCSDEYRAGEAAVGEKAMVAPGDTKACDQVHDHKQDDIQRAENLVPRKHGGRHETDPRHKDCHQSENLGAANARAGG